MKPALPAALIPFAVTLYLVVGQWVSTRVRRQESKADRVLFRAAQRTGHLLLLATAVVFVLVYVHREDLGSFRTSVLLYALPLFWLFAEVSGRSWLELRAGRSDASFFAFARFNLFEAFLLGGQRLPLVSAAFAMPADLENGIAVIPGVALHLGIAILLGVLTRWFVVRRVARVRPFPDDALVAEIRDVAERAAIRLKDLRLVPTERGQSVNAVAATSSSVIYVAQGLLEGLERSELKAVLLHELGHFGQPFTNRFRNATSLALPGLVWLFRARAGLGLTTEGEILGVLTVTLGATGGWFLARWLFAGAEVRADRFAERWGDEGALAHALTKMYALNVVPNSRHHRRGRRDPALTERLEMLSRRSSAVPS